MKEKELQISTSLQIGKSPEQVFEAIVEPKHMKNYFISESSGRMKVGISVNWKFDELNTLFPVEITGMEANRYISFNWEGTEGETQKVEIFLEERQNGNTLVTIKEGNMPVTEKGIKWLKNNTEGWANFLACLKAYLEFGINLRKGGYDFYKDNR